MAARARTPVARRRLRTKARQRPALRYRQTRATIAILIFMVFFGVLWLINGDFTAQFITMLTNQPATTGWSLHVFVSLTEFAPAVLAPYTRDLPLPARMLVWCLSVPFAFADVFSSAVGIMPYLAGLDISVAWQSTIATALAELVAVAPEKMIVLLFVSLIAVLRSKQ